MSDTYLHIKDLTVNFKSFDGVKEVLNIDELKIKKGEAYGIAGESGTGKTVLALTILGLLATPPGEIASGEIWLDGQNLRKQTSKYLQKNVRGKKISMIFQDPMSTLNPVFTVGQQMKNVIKNNQGLMSRPAYNEALNCLNLVKLPDPERLMDKYPHELSGGQRQRVIIALSLCCKSDLIIADEPTRNLDVTIQAGILKLLKELQRELKVTLLFITNNPGLLYSTCDYAAILYRGMILEKGTVNELFKDPKHPYTYMLLNTVPKEKGEKINLDKLVAETEFNKDAKCRFYNRCAYKEECCKEEQNFAHIGGTHFVRCKMFKNE